jgi:NTE family protein
VYDLDYVIAVDAGRGRAVKRPAFLPGRLVRSFDITHNETQDGTGHS